MARPKKKRDERRSSTFRIRLTQAERNLFEEAAKKKGLDASAWARMALLAAAKEG